MKSAAHALCLTLFALRFSLFALPLLAQEPSQVDLPTIEEPSDWAVPPTLMLRARVTELTPNEPTDIAWRWGGEGLGGTVTRGVFGQKLAVGEWSPAVPAASFVPGRFPARLFLTVTVGRGGKLIGRGLGGWIMENHSTGVDVEFEASDGGRVLKTFRSAGPNGGTVGIVIPAYRLAGGKGADDPDFLAELTGLREYAEQRAGALEKLPWAGWPLPKLFAVTTNLGGYGEGSYFAIRYTDPAVVAAECRALRQLGVNGLCEAPPFLLKMIGDREGYAAGLHRMLYTQPGGYPVAGAREPDPGCPYAPGVAERTKANVATALELAKLPVDEVWARTVDEIGAVVDGTPEGKAHLALCPNCAEGFRAYLKGLGVTPADVGKADWEQVRPLNIWPKAGEAMPDLSTRGAGLLGYHTAMFLNESSARLFTPLRDALAQANEAKRKAMVADPNSAAAKQPLLLSFALRGNTFLMGGHSLDFFDYYRKADNAFVYETSNRDARVWGWDSYLCDVGRVVSAAQKIRLGIYVKPHRGAPLQRALSAAARGASMVYWYTYGPDYSKGDSFSQSPEALALTSKAAHLLGKTESVLYGARWMRPAEVAVVTPRSSEIWMRLSGSAPERVAAFENAKWVYAALAHAHVPVDPVDEVMLATGDLSRYKVIYVSGPNLTRAAAAKLAGWVKAGGTLVTSGGGLARNEANQPLTAIQPVLGLRERAPAQMWYKVSLYGASSLEPYGEPGRTLAPVPTGAKVTAGAPFNATLDPVIGREVLLPDAGTEVLGRFGDGGAAITRHPYGEGQAYVLGFFPGLEYSAPVRTDRFDMARDLDAGRRALVAAPALAAASPVVDASQPLVEGVLLRHPGTGKRAVALMNWAYRVAALRKDSNGRTSPVIGLAPFENVKVTLRGAGPVAAATSAMLGTRLPAARAGDTVVLTLPRLEEGDVLLLE